MPSSPTLKLGKLPAVKNSVSLRLRDYLSLVKLPVPPQTVDHEHAVLNWQMLGNDEYGDCVWAGAAHETMMWGKNAGRTIMITTADVLKDYSADTGFNPNNPATDQGTDVAKAAKYRRKTGILDVSGARHKVQAYLAITPGNREELKQAIYLFENVGIGWQLPASAQQQFLNGEPWSVVAGSQIEGGHYTPAVGYDANYVYIVTWAKVQRVEWAFFDKYCDEAITYLSAEMLTNGKSMEGFSASQLQSDLSAL